MITICAARRRLSANRTAGRSGFNLIEAAIVLGIVGLIVGGIWVAASAVYENLRTGRASQELLQIAQAVRTLHGSQTTIASGNISAAMVAARAIPNDMILTAGGTQPQNPWQGNVDIYGITSISASDGPGFWVVFNGLPQNGCVDLAIRNSGSARDIGMVRVSLSSSAQGSSLGGTSGVVPPVTVVQAASSCSDNSANNNSAAFLFRIRG
ncbi:MAG: hypothetical protein GC131_07080 [Alphaproteobacteria bacterium]|nr:hypothetical protein [Alphaproteobacteria bacterium]